MPKVRQTRPKSGYQPDVVLDANEYDEEVHCEVCNRSLRWVHLLIHTALDHPVEVGCICAAKMCFGYGADSAETDAKNRAERLRRFRNNDRWKRSANGNPTRKYKKMRVTIFESYGMWKYSIQPSGKQVRYSQAHFNTEADAKLGAFEWFEKFAE
jgi:hypothetical protein